MKTLVFVTQEAKEHRNENTNNTHFNKNLKRQYNIINDEKVLEKTGALIYPNSFRQIQLE